jgi:hypothetical protein
MVNSAILMAAQLGGYEFMNNLIRKAEQSDALTDIIKKSATPIPLSGVTPISKIMLDSPVALLSAQF